MLFASEWWDNWDYPHAITAIAVVIGFCFVMWLFNKD
jgi:hypothetical protein